ncbi:hypothetical protein P153DRAFT_251991, partial [Dothidotthia symphoricarpi CBS 119687]
MAKTAKLKKKQTTVHSRAARRAVSPSINLDKTVKDLPKTTTDPSEPKHHVLSAQKAGIQKAKKGNLKRSQRLRHQKGLERGADNMDKLELKRIKSFGRELKVKERAKGWEDVNGVATKKTKKGTFDVLDDEADDKAEREWVSDDEMDDEV